jgi:hypothetical protein
VAPRTFDHLHRGPGRHTSRRPCSAARANAEAKGRIALQIPEDQEFTRTGARSHLGAAHVRETLSERLEKHLYSIFDGLNAEEREGLGNAFDGYSALRMNGNGECLFSNHLADKVRNAPLESKDFAAAALGQGLALTLKHDFIQAGGVPGPGQVRLWKNPADIEGPAELGPWPWITSIALVPNPDTIYWFGNEESVRPEPPAQTHVWKEHQFEQVCSFKPLPTGGIDQSCDRLVMKPPPPPPRPARRHAIF